MSKTSDLRAAVKAVVPRARITGGTEGVWTIRTEDPDVVQRLLKTLGLEVLSSDIEGTRHDWINVLHVVEAGEATMPTRPKQKKTASQLDREIRESMLVSDAEIEAFLETLDVRRDPEDQGMVDDVYSALMGDDKARARLTAIIRPARIA